MNVNPEPRQPYRGRFAPSPSGPLHFGSLVCALASYLDAKANHGKWLVRIEDIDPPREQKGASESILETLQAHGLFWDEELLYQSSRSEAYQKTLAYFLENNLAYRCACTRKRLLDLPGVYDGYCLNTRPQKNQAAALRLNLKSCLRQIHSKTSFIDLIQGEQSDSLKQTGDFVIHRKDGLFAYQLAVVIDDIAQEITRVVRGVDLLDTTSQQLYLFQLLGRSQPQYAHIPVLVDTTGNKLSKQNHAIPVANQNALENLRTAFQLLGMQTSSTLANDIPRLLEWGIAHWNLENVPQCSSIPAPSHTM